MAKRATLAGRRVEGIKFGTNPCSEIILRDKQFCNLSTIVAKSTDTEEDLYRKVAIAAFLGTMQSALTNFTFFEERGDFTFRENCSEERLLGVSITGIMDCPLINGSGSDPVVEMGILNTMKEIAHDVNRKWASVLNINPSASVTCVKPEGTTSCVAGSSSGMHPRYAPYYIRRVRLDAKDPIVNLMKDQGVPNEPCVMNPDHTVVFSFPMKAPEESLVTSELNAIDHLDLWKLYQEQYCDHKPSITISYKDTEFLNVGGWVWKEWDIISGISFLPSSDHIYQQAPFEEINEEEYNKLVVQMPNNVDWDLLSKYEKEDETKNNHTLSCTAGGCELV
jgi:ribonucleoside-diphosphate reductase alpha chain